MCHVPVYLRARLVASAMNASRPKGSASVASARAQQKPIHSKTHQTTSNTTSNTTSDTTSDTTGSITSDRTESQVLETKRLVLKRKDVIEHRMSDMLFSPERRSKQQSHTEV